MVRLLACGFNGHSQLSLVPEGSDEANSKDVRTLTTLTKGKDLAGTRVLWAGWSSTVLLVDSIIYILGYFSSAKTPQLLPLPQNDISTSSIRSVFGDINGPLGLLTWSGSLYQFVSMEGHISLARRGNATSPTLSHVAVQSSGRTAIIFLQARGSKMIHILEFEDFDAFSRWYDDPSAASSDVDAPKSFIHHMMAGRAASLLGGATCFVLLTEEGEVFTWGDGRHSRCLGRAVESDDPTSEPCAVSALAGIHISKIDGRGWSFGALSKDGDLYFWGRDKPGVETGLGDMLGNADIEVKLLDDERFENVHDFAIGNGHILVATKENHVFAIGENRNGQAGLAEVDANFTGEWREFNGIRPTRVGFLFAGDASTFVSLEP